MPNARPSEEGESHWRAGDRERHGRDRSQQQRFGQRATDGISTLAPLNLERASEDDQKTEGHREQPTHDREFGERPQVVRDQQQHGGPRVKGHR